MNTSDSSKCKCKVCDAAWHCGEAPAPEPSETDLAMPIIIPAQRDWGGASTAIAASPNGRRVYIGLKADEPGEAGIMVIAIGDDGKLRKATPIPVPLPFTGASVVVTALHFEPRFGRKLYAGLSVSQAVGPGKGDLLIYDLDERHDVVGEPQVVNSGATPSALRAMTVHPTLPILYFVSIEAKVRSVALDAGSGAPVGAVQATTVGDHSLIALEASLDGASLWLGDKAGRFVARVALDVSGAILPKTFTTMTTPDTLKSQHFLWTHHGLLVSPTVRLSTSPQYLPNTAFWFRSFGPQGLADGPVDERARTTGTAAAYDRAKRALFLAEDTTFTTARGALLADGVMLRRYLVGADGAGVGETVASVPDAYGNSLTVTSNGVPVMLTRQRDTPEKIDADRVIGTHLRFCVHGMATTDKSLPPGKLNGTVAGVAFTDVAVGAFTKWLDLSAYLEGRAGSMLVSLAFSVPKATDMDVEIEVANGDPVAAEALVILRSGMRATFQSATMYLLVPGQRTRPESRQVKWLHEHAETWAIAARPPVGLALEARPKKIAIGCSHAVGMQGQRDQLAFTAETIGWLGCNMATLKDWGALPGAEVGKAFNDQGVTRRSSGVHPPADFSFHTQALGDLDHWAERELVAKLIASGAAKEDLAALYMNDEPGWPTPDAYHKLLASDIGRQRYRAYIADKAAGDPAYFGVPGFDDVFGLLPLGVTEADTLQRRRIFYWTLRFLQEEAIAATRIARDAIVKYVGHDVPVFANYHDDNMFMRNSPNAVLGHNTSATPSSGMAYFDWLEVGRRGAQDVGSEDWHPDTEAILWSYRGDLLRSAAKLGRFNAYVVGVRVGAVRDGAVFKMLSVIGRGSRAVTLWTFGPMQFDPTNGFSDNTQAYASIAKASGIIARAEHVLADAVPERGRVAVLAATPCMMWQHSSDLAYFFQEERLLVQTLTHAGWSADLVDSTDIEQGALQERGHRALFLVGPNISRAAVRRVESWVAQGGTLAVLPGAGTVDEFNEPVGEIDALLSVAPREPIRDPAPDLWRRVAVSEVLAPQDDSFGHTLVDLRYPIRPLAGNARVLASSASGAALITGHDVGSGRALAFGFYPGLNYWYDATDFLDGNMPGGFIAAKRRIVAAVPEMAQVPRTVEVDTSMIEALRLDAPNGTAVVLLNWSGTPRGCVQVRVKAPRQATKVTLASGRRVVAWRCVCSGVEAIVPVDTGDILLLE